MQLFVTGGAGFIGSAFIRRALEVTSFDVLNIDKLTYAGNLASLASVQNDPRYRLVQADICDQKTLSELFTELRPDAVIHLAAESHVDRSIDQPSHFITTNVNGTFSLLEASRRYLATADEPVRRAFRFLHVSTDEVYGSLGATGTFTEQSPYQPNSPYSATKAAADHLVRAWHHTYGLPVLTCNCSNNYGPYQHPEKLIPLMTLNALEGRPLPIYGSGQNVRDWLYVEDHVDALLTVLARGQVGETYNIGGNSERTNLEVVETICSLVDELPASRDRPSAHRLINFVRDRPGHDFRYAIDASKLASHLGFRPRHDFTSGLAKTIAWYSDNADGWCRRRQAESERRRRGDPEKLYEA